MKLVSNNPNLKRTLRRGGLSVIEGDAEVQELTKALSILERAKGIERPLEDVRELANMLLATYGRQENANA